MLRCSDYEFLLKWIRHIHLISKLIIQNFTKLGIANEPLLQFVSRNVFHMSVILKESEKH